MTETDQQDSLRRDLVTVLNRYRDEFDLSLASAIGVVETIKHCMVMEAYEVVVADDLMDSDDD